MIAIGGRVRIDYRPMLPGEKSLLFQGMMGLVIRTKVRTKDGVTCVVKLDKPFETENGNRYQWVYEEERFLRPIS